MTTLKTLQEEIVREVHTKWLSKAKTAKIDGSEMTVLPYGYLSQAVEEVLLARAKKDAEIAKLKEEDVLYICSRCGGKFLPLGHVIEKGKHYPAFTVKYADGREEHKKAYDEIKEALCKQCSKEVYDEAARADERKQKDHVLICDGMRTGIVGTVGGKKGESVAVCIDVEGHDCGGMCPNGGTYEPEYALLHFDGKDARAVELLVSHLDERKKAYEEGKNAAVDYLKENSTGIIRGYTEAGVPIVDEWRVDFDTFQSARKA